MTLKRIWLAIYKYIRQMISMMKVNWEKQLIFVLLFVVVNAFATSATANFLLDLALKIRGMEYISNENFLTFLLHPATIVILYLALVCFTAFSIFEIAGLMHAYHMGRMGKRTKIYCMIGAGFNACIKCLDPRNWHIMVFMLAAIPFTGAFAFATASFYLLLPNFIKEYMLQNIPLTILYYSGFITLIIVAVTNIFSLNNFCLFDKSFRKSCQGSRRLIRKRLLRTIGFMVVIWVLLYLGSTAIAAVISEGSISIMSVFSGGTAKISDTSRLASQIMLIKDVIMGCIAPMVNIGTISVMFYDYSKRENIPIDLPKDVGTYKKRFGFPKVVALLVFVGLAICYNIYSHRYDKYSINQKPIRPDIVAHRGDSVRAPENTMPAFVLAVNEGVDIIELDVHETKDGEIIVCHDNNLNRVSGQKIFVNETNYEDIKDLDVGSWFSPEFSYVRISKLEEALDFFGDYEDIDIQIEIKPNGASDTFEEKVVDVIKNSQIKNNVAITCMKLDSLKKIEEIYPEMETIYSMILAWQKIETIDEVDGFTIEYSNAREALVERIHAAGKKVYVWTINGEDVLQQMADFRVDGILTDDPVTLGDALDNVSYSAGFPKLFRTFINKTINGY